MKAILIPLIALAFGTTCVQAQSLISIAGRPVGSVQTNTSVIGGSGGITGPIPTQTQAGAASYFALLIASTTTAGDTSPFGPDWSQAQVFGSPGTFITATNSLNLVGGVSGTGGVNGVAVDGWIPGTAMNLMLVGWSANLGTSWSQVSGELPPGNLSGYFGYFGYSAIANLTSLGYGSPPPPPQSIFGAGIQGFDLFASPVPEPATLALAGLGGLSMLFLRRHKN